MDPSTFYLGCSTPSWLHDEVEAPLFLALHRIRRWLSNEDWPRRPRVRWALDSGGFNHVRKNGGWVLSPEDFVGEVWSHSKHVDGLQWAAPQDWMCEEDVLDITGRTVAEHQALTVANFPQVCAEWERLEDDATRWLGDEVLPSDRRPCPFIPVLQGDPADLDSHLRCVDMYAAAGVDLWSYPVVGLGSVCREQATSKVVRIVERLWLETGLPLHGFGVKTDGLRLYGDLLASADSHAWSATARRQETTCKHGLVRWERNCHQYAIEWREQVLAGLPAPRAPRDLQAALF